MVRIKPIHSESSGGWKGGRAARAAAPGRHFAGAGAAFDRRKFGILAFALQRVSVSLYLFLIYSVHPGGVLPVGGAALRTFAPGGNKPSRCHRPNHACYGCADLSRAVWIPTSSLLDRPTSVNEVIFSLLFFMFVCLFC